MAKNDARLRYIRLSVWFIVNALTIAFVYVLSLKDFVKDGAPPIGRFFSPFHGFWQNTEGEKLENAAEFTLNFKGLQKPVQIFIDTRMTPHIFAQNEHDLYFAQGYVTARFRLWQMETQTRAAGGRLAEILGPKLLDFDRKQRRLGMMQAAREAVAFSEKDSISRLLTNAYTEGVNAYISALQPREYPFEYKLLDYAPEAWTPLKTALLLKYMAWDLTSGWNEVYLSKFLKKYDAKTLDVLFPNFSPYTDPTIPTGTKWDFEKLPIPKSEFPFAVKEDWLETLGKPPEKQKDNGSNNWAIGGERSTSGFPILANDPHLSLRLPSLWFEIQLNAPGVNAYGVSLPGAPSIIIGFNESVSWGVTNVGADVMDWYQIRFKDKKQNEYFYENEWHSTRKITETINVRGAATHTERVVYTHQGPVAFPDLVTSPALPLGCALRWAAHQPSNEILTFYYLNRAKKYSDYTSALKYYYCPAQNFVYADNEKNIALWVNGRFPLKYPEQGKFILDGTKKSNNWQGFIPHAQNPHVKNPGRGFVSSANQAPTDTTYPYYLDWYWETFERGARINQRLEAMRNANWDSLRMLQNDNYNLLAEKVTPKLLSYLENANFDGVYLDTYKTIRLWDYQNSPESVGATVFNLWWAELMKRIWADDFGGETALLPDRAVTARLILEQPNARWFDDVQTPQKETLAQLVHDSFKAAHDSLARHASEPMQRRWGAFKGTRIPHLANIPGLGVDSLFVGGGEGIVNATKKTHGPSWRMVVAMGGVVRGYGIYPGGQSGHPGSLYYDNFVQKWAKGSLDELYFMYRPENLKRIKTKITLNP